MSLFLVKWVANRVLRDNQLNKFGVEDPYYEYIPLDDAGKRTKKIKRRIPEGLSKNDIVVLEDVKRKAKRFDMWFSVFGIQIGWSNIVGIVPIVGQLVATYWSLTLLVSARKLDDGLPLDIHLLFVFNILVDFLLGLIPIVGDLIEIGYKANLRNFLLLEKHLARVGQKNLGLIEPNEVRANFINDKIQPVLEESIVPGTLKAGEQIKHFVSDQYSAYKKGLVKPGTVPSPTATTQTSADTAAPQSYTADSLVRDDDLKSIRSVKGLNERYAD